MTEVRELIGVYNADGGVRGELAYAIGKIRGTAHCGLCDITHGRVRERADWSACRAGLPVPFETYHLDDQPEAIRELTAAGAPVVIALTTGEAVRLLGPHELDACSGSPQRLLEAIEAAVAERGLSWP